MTEPSFHSGFCAVIGRPNVGKSTLLNRLIGEKISIISNKPQTTRNQIRLIYTEKRMQVIFLDTPGVQMPRNELGEVMLKMSTSALDGADLILLVVDQSERYGRLDAQIFEALSKVRDIPILLLLNKIDEGTPETLKSLEESYRDRGTFSAILPISAKEGTGLDALREAIYEHLPEGPQYYPEEMITDRSERFVLAEILREKCLHNLQEEIPHGIFVGIDSMKQREGQEFYDIYATIYVEKASHKGMVIGKGGQMLRRIGTQARQEMETLLAARVNLKLWVKVEKDWRKKKKKVSDFGYES